MGEYRNSRERSIVVRRRENGGRIQCWWKRSFVDDASRRGWSNVRVIVRMRACYMQIRKYYEIVTFQHRLRHQLDLGNIDLSEMTYRGDWNTSHAFCRSAMNCT